MADMPIVNPISLIGKIIRGKTEIAVSGFAGEQVLSQVTDAYKDCKNELYAAIEADLRLSYGNEIGGLLAAYATNIATNEPDPPQLLDKIPESDRAKAYEIAETLRKHDELAIFVADAAWWRAQGEIMTAYKKRGEASPEIVVFSLNLLETSIAIAPTESRFYETRAWIYMVAGQISEGHEAAQEAIIHDATSFEAWRLKGVATYLLGNPEHAVACFDIGLTLDPSNSFLKTAIKIARSKPSTWA